MVLPDLNVNEVAFNDDTGVDGDKEIREALFFSDPDTVFEKAVVVEVINDPAGFKNQKEFEIKYNETSIVNFKFITRTPRNSVIIRPINSGKGVRTNKYEIALPFFPPHLCFPVKPGEHVWVVKPSSPGTSSEYLHWISRVPSWDDVEDLNYSHEDRRHHFQVGDDAADDPVAESENAPPPSEENSKDFEMFGFPNGTGADGGFTFGDDKNEYCIQSTGSLAYYSFKYEPVPRLTKRPADMVLQGSNNTSIILGTTGHAIKGGWSAEGKDKERLESLQLGEKEPLRSIATVPQVEEFSANPGSEREIDPIKEITDKFAPAIDIIAGRGYRVRDGGISHDSTDQEKLPIEREGDLSHAPTYPRVKETVVDSDNPRGTSLSETSKNPGAFHKDLTDSTLDHAIEGDPDFRYDAARVYIAADGKADVDFGLSEEDGAKVKFSVDNEVDVQSGSSVVLKSDHVRIIARKDPDAGVSNQVNGSIRIIKEGAPADNTGKFEPNKDKRAVIAIEPDGTIYIDGPKIIIAGREDNAEGPAANGAGEQLFIGKDASEPLVLGSQLQGILSAIINVLDNHIHPTGTGPSGKRVPGGEETPTGAFKSTVADIDDLKLMLSKVGKTK